MTTINVPDELVHAIDLLAGVNQRSAYIVDVLWKEIRRTRQHKALHESVGAWKPENHPELVHGGAAFIEKPVLSAMDDSKTHWIATRADGHDPARFLGNQRRKNSAWVRCGW